MKGRRISVWCGDRWRNALILPNGSRVVVW